MLRLPAIVALGICFILSLACLSFAEEKLTITTYYPSPYGSYRELRAQRMAIGEFYINSGLVCWPPDNCAQQTFSDVDLLVEGNVGIGTIYPKVKVQINSTAEPPMVAGTPSGNLALLDFNGLYGMYLGVVGRTGESWIQAARNDAATYYNLSLQANGGYVGIGTTNPAGLLHIHSSTSQGAMTISGISDAGLTYSAIYLDDDITSPPARNSWVIGHRKNIGLPYENSFSIGHFDINGNMIAPVWINTSGNVGIGTAVPGEKLEVNGNVKINTGGAANRPVCWKADGQTLGYCNAPLDAATGACPPGQCLP